MKYILSILACLVICVSVGAAENNLPKIRNSHPRIIVRNSDIPALKKKLESDAPLQVLYRKVEQQAQKALRESVSVRKKQGKRLLHISRKVLERVCSCSFMYLYTSDPKYAVRAQEEMLAAAAFTDWNPSHFLDTGEMTAALAIGYDWLYDFLGPENRRIIAQAIHDKGLFASTNPRHYWFYTSTNNWNQVCNAGLVMGAVATWELWPNECQAQIMRSLESNPTANSCYGPDGVYPEGYDYWDYGTVFEVMLIETLRTAFGTSFSLEKAPGLLESAYFMCHAVAPSLAPLNFSDCPAFRSRLEPVLYWFARENRDMSLLWAERETTLRERKPSIGCERVLALDLLYASRCNLGKAKAPKKLWWFGRGEQPVFIYRTEWGKPDAALLALKGGRASMHHAHMDAGEFFYEAMGERWSTDLGSQSYITLESKGVDLWNRNQNSQRWEVFRLSERSHSTLSIPGKRHMVDAAAYLKDVSADRSKAEATVEMGEVLGIERASRHFSLESATQTLRITDSLKSGEECRARWTLNTEAEITPTKDGAQLRLNGKLLSLHAECSTPFKVFIEDNSPKQPYDMDNPRSRRVILEFTLRAGEDECLRVTLTPGKEL